MTYLVKKLKSFANDTKGNITVEAVIIMPLLFWAVAAMAIFFDVYRTKSKADKAAFTISDMLSRETNSITPDYITNTRTLFDAMTGYSSTYEPVDPGDPFSGYVDDGTGMRISVITWNEDESEYELEWSKERGDDFVALTAGDLPALADRLPNMADQDAVILVETYNTYEPVLDVGLGSTEISTFVFTRPRYAPQLPFDSST